MNFIKSLLRCDIVFTVCFLLHETVDRTVQNYIIFADDDVISFERPPIQA